MAAAQPVEFSRQVRIGLGIGRKRLVPSVAERFGALGHGAVQVVDDAVGHQELRVFRPAIDLLGCLDDVGAHGIAVRLGGAGDWRAEADDAVEHDQGRGVAIGLEGLDGAGKRPRIVGIIDVDDRPAIAFEALADVLAEGQRRAALDGDAVAVVDPAQVAELLMAGDRGGFGRHTFHHIAVTAEDVDVIVEQGGVGCIEMCAQPAAGNRHAHRIAATLAQRPGRRLYTGGDAVFRVARRLGIELTEVFDVVEADRGLAGRLAIGVDLLDRRHMQQRIEQHRGVTARQHEPVAIGPVRPVGIVAQEAVPQRISRRRQGHRRPRMAGLGLFNRVHGQGADGVDAEGVDVAPT